MPLTKRQKEILDFVSLFLERHGYSPTLEEIATYFNLASLNGVFKHLQALQEGASFGVYPTKPVPFSF